jgi:hypothetical protein
MISIKYSSLTNKITVYQDGKKKEFTVYGDVNLQALRRIKKYFKEEIEHLCVARINALRYAPIKSHTGEKTEMLHRILYLLPKKLEKPDFCFGVLQLLSFAGKASPGTESRYRKNYILKLKELYDCAKFYENKEKYYEVEETAIQLCLF